jgi:phosphoenolpyruvate-protein phosphotransferase (PTS system enzyme I)
MANNQQSIARTLKGQPAAPGFAAGPIVSLNGPRARERRVGNPGEERALLERAVRTSHEELTRLAADVGKAEAEAILEVQIALLEDDALLAPIFEAVEAGQAAHLAWETALDAEIAAYEAAENTYFAQRSSDLRDLRDRVATHIAGTLEGPLPSGSIVLADDITPSRFLSIQWHNGGVALRRGSATSHVAILARALGVPMIVGIDAEPVSGRQEGLLDADAGTLIVNPDAAARATFGAWRAEAERRRVSEATFLGRPAITANGERVLVMINVGGAADLKSAKRDHVDGIGLVRTEFLFQDRPVLPDEEEQFAIYRDILDWAMPRPVVIRTLDVGGDKPIAGLTVANESDPFLGVRGVRLSLRRPEVFGVQLRALARAAVVGNLKVMIPMVTVPGEMQRCRTLMQQAVRDLVSAGIPAALPAIGMMVEVPAAALAVEEFDADFYSIGSNDLIQYVAAASRSDASLAELATPSKALFALIRGVVEGGRRLGREVSLCGDLGGDIRHIDELLGTGLRSISVAPPMLSSVKAAIARHGAARGAA